VPFQAPLTLGGLPKPTAQQIAGLSTPAEKAEDWTERPVLTVRFKPRRSQFECSPL